MGSGELKRQRLELVGAALEKGMTFGGKWTSWGTFYRVPRRGRGGSRMVASLSAMSAIKATAICKG
jgi:hypothetical protein